MPRPAAPLLLTLSLLAAPRLAAQGPGIPRPVGIAPARAAAASPPFRQTGGSATGPSGTTIGALVGAGLFAGLMVVAVQDGGIPGDSRGEQIGVVVLSGAAFLGLGALIGAIVGK